MSNLFLNLISLIVVVGLVRIIVVASNGFCYMRRSRQKVIA